MGVSRNDATRLFLQACIARRVMSDRVARLLWKKCGHAVHNLDQSLEFAYDEGSFDEVVGHCNNVLSPLDMAFQSGIDEVTGEKMWAMVNTKSDEISQLATEYNAAEISFFKAVVEEIMTAPNESFSVSSIVALRQLKNAKVGKTPLTRVHGEVLLSSFVANGWLYKSVKGRYSLSTRARMELQQYLTDTFEDYLQDQECITCHDYVLSGVRCTTPACKVRLHQHCFNTWRRKKPTCPQCQHDWSTHNFELRKIGEDAPRDNEEWEGGQSGSEDEEKRVKKGKKRAVAKQKGKNRAANNDEDSDSAVGDDMAVSDDNGAGSQTQGRRRRK